ncbi:MAG: SMC-Scp complex subunit ScpB [Beijerinckiaceae bacterium]
MAELAQLFAHVDRSQWPARDDGWAEAMRIAEALLFAAAEPLAEKDIEKRLPRGVAAGAVLEELKADYATRGVNLVRAGGKWMFRTAVDLAWLLAAGEGEIKRLSRAALETLAIIAYHQPVTRAEIEDIRGVAISKGTLDLLLETGWVRLRGRRRAPGRPITYGTTEAFLIHFGLETIGDLPGREELKGAGLFDGRLPRGFGVPEPCDGAELAEDEDPLEDDTSASFVAGTPTAGPEEPAWHEDFARAKEALPASEDRNA